ncbi:MAG: hypothetical protein KJ787_14070 [Gammaproteobacteria bacterium]|nr:hypothetical protein [Gammaproteobacteria bacterium]MBU1647454.1 hypothetical protein [Gammaproteobacteria bacterium]MBU1973246.1 hypothetical protein [Gammaproteobacteria bacterium]
MSGIFGSLVRSLAGHVEVETARRQRRKARTEKATATLRRISAAGREQARSKILKFLVHHVAPYRVIAHELGLSEEGTRLALVAMEADGLVRREREGNSDWWRLV